MSRPKGLACPLGLAAIYAGCVYVESNKPDQTKPVNDSAVFAPVADVANAQGGPDTMPMVLDVAATSPDAPVDWAVTPDAPDDGGRPDAAEDAPRAPRSCQPRSVRAVYEPFFGQKNTPAPVCEVDRDGVLTMTYETVPGCPVYEDRQRPYRACYFGQNEDVVAFQRGQGLFEARYCFEGPLYEDLNIWFDTQTNPSVALTFARLHRADDSTKRSCRTVLFSVGDSCISEGKCNAACVDGGVAEPDASDPVDATGGDGGASVDADGGSDATRAPACARFERVKVRITTEWCQCPPKGCVRPLNAQVQLRSLLYHAEECLCDSDSDCDPGTFCRRDALSPEASCWTRPGGCRGVCAP